MAAKCLLVSDSQHKLKAGKGSGTGTRGRVRGAGLTCVDDGTGPRAQGVSRGTTTIEYGNRQLRDDPLWREVRGRGSTEQIAGCAAPQLQATRILACLGPRDESALFWLLYTRQGSHAANELCLLTSTAF